MARRAILVGGVTLSFLSSAGCGVVMGLGQTKGDRLGVGVMSALSWLVICFVGTLILYGLAGPGRKPLAPGSVPQGVTFDPTRSAPSHAPPASVASPAPDSWYPPPTRTGSPLYGQR